MATSDRERTEPVALHGAGSGHGAPGHPGSSHGGSGGGDLRPGHEKRDVDVRNVALAGTALLVGSGLALVAMLVLFRYFASREAKSQAPPSSLAGTAAALAPPEPRLQTAPVVDLERL